MPGPFGSEVDLKQALDHDAARRQAEAAIPPAPLPPDPQRAQQREIRRVQLAGYALTGLINHAGFNVEPQKVAREAVRIADAMLVELEKK